MSRLALAVALAASLAVSLVGPLGGCKKEAKEDAAKVAPAASGPAKPAKDGVRRVSIEANADGYVPDKIPGKPGEKLVLVFTRTIDAGCISQLKTPDGTLVDLPKDKPVEVPITVPPTGELTFACGMDMFHGAIVADTGAGKS